MMKTYAWCLVSIFILIVISTLPSGPSKTIVVDDDGGKWTDYSSIHDAIINASENDIIRIYDGFFTKSFLINQSVTIIGNGSKTVLHGNGSNTMIEINLNGSNSTISDINVTNAKTGIDISSMNVTIVDSTFSDNGRAIVGINYAWLTIDNCIFTTNNIGILFGGPTFSVIRNCIFTSNVEGIYVGDGWHVIIENNTIESSASRGIYIDADNITVRRNNIRDNMYGIKLYHSTNSQILWNNITGSENYAIIIEHIGYPRPEGNMICWNNISNNGFSKSQAYDSWNNSWDNELKGNQWSDYQGYDLDGDGIGESAYHIDGPDNMIDHYPMTDRYLTYGIELFVDANPTLIGNTHTIFAKITQSIPKDDVVVSFYLNDFLYDNITTDLNGTIYLQFQWISAEVGEYTIVISVDSDVDFEESVDVTVISIRKNSVVGLPNFGYVVLALTTVLLATIRRRSE